MIINAKIIGCKNFYTSQTGSLSSFPKGRCLYVYHQLYSYHLWVVAIVWGIYTLLKSIRQNQDVLATDAIEHDKDGLPIIPRHQRPEPQENPVV